mgnify:CR=1 FL=1
MLPIGFASVGNLSVVKLLVKKTDVADAKVIIDDIKKRDIKDNDPNLEKES